MKKYLRAAIAAIQVLAVSPAFAQTLPPINGKLLAFSSFIYGGATNVISSIGPLALTSAQFSYFGTTTAYAFIQRVVYSGAGCTGTVTTVGKTFYVALSGYQTVQLTYPTPLSFFPDASNIVCISVYNSGASSMAINFVGYTQ